MFLLTRPNHDNATNYLYHWSKELIEESVGRGIKVFDLSGKKCNRKNLLSYYKKHKPSLIFFNGHGNEKQITGFDNEILVDTDLNKSKFTDSVIYCRSCKSAVILGKYLVKNGLVAFIGYKGNFVVKSSKKYSTNPLEDKLASFYLEPSNLIIKVLLKGKSVKEANERSKKMILKNIKKVFASVSSDKEDTARWLYHNYCIQTVIGDCNKKCF